MKKIGWASQDFLDDVLSVIGACRFPMQESGPVTDCPF
jgi:hypothetical protein